MVMAEENPRDRPGFCNQREFPPLGEGYAYLYGEADNEIIDLAGALYKEMERLDPSSDGEPKPFSALDEWDSLFYRCCAERIFGMIKSKSKMRPTTTS